jgi:uncharacterized protein with von Willebrand factor type A (vWA) domain
MSAATVSSIAAAKAPRSRKPKTATAQPPQPTDTTAPTGQTQPGQMAPPTVPANSATIDAAAAAAADALKAATDRAVSAKADLPAALAAIDSAETDKREHFIAVYQYFDRDKGFAWRNLDGFSTMDAAIARYYNVPDGDTAALKAARDVNTYRRRLGAKFSGLLLMGQTAPTAQPTETKVKAEQGPAALLGKYLKGKWNKLTLAEQESTLKEYTTQWLARLKAEQPERYAAHVAAQQPTAQPRTGTDG